MERRLTQAQPQGHGRQVTSRLAIRAVGNGQRFAAGAAVWHVPEQPVAAWVRGCWADGSNGAPRPQPTGRPPHRTPTPKAALAARMAEGPSTAGCRRACWRSPMIPPVIYARFGVCSNVCDSAQLRKNLGGRDPPAACGSAPRADRPRPAWCTTTWPQMLRLATARTALRRLGDAAACPQGGPRSSTGARPGHQPRGKTSGQRQGAHVVGVRESCTGRFRAQGQAGRRTAATSRALLPRVWAPLTPPLRLMQDGATYPTSLALPRVCARHTERGLVFPWPSASPAEKPSEQLWKNVTNAGTPFPDWPTVQARTDPVEHALLTCATTPKASRALCRLPTEVAQVASVRLGRKSLS